MADWQSGFYKLTIQQRQQLIQQHLSLDSEEVALLQAGTSFWGSQMIENYVANYVIPEGVAVNFIVNQKEYTVPMVTEEPSVIAAASNAAKIISQNGGFFAPDTPRMMVGQVVVETSVAFDDFKSWVKNHESDIIDIANTAHPSMLKRGAGAKSIRVRQLEGFISVDLLIDVSESMGANVVNTMSEAVKRWFQQHDFIVLTAILSNMATESLQKATCEIPVSILGMKAAQQIVKLSQLAQVDPYRATTHNKGIMNGIDSLMIATGNDWRAIESGAHAYAAISGQYRGLTTWQINGDKLVGTIELPLPVGIVGGSMGIVPLVKVNQNILKINSAAELAQIAASLGLAQNFAALKALATEGIQAGHMKLQYKTLAVEAGANQAEVDKLVTRLNQLTKVDREVVVQELRQMREENKNG